MSFCQKYVNFVSDKQLTTMNDSSENKPTFINPCIDHYFKQFFGQSSSGFYLISLLNSLFKDDPGFSPIVPDLS